MNCKPKVKYALVRRGGNYYITRDGAEMSCAIHNGNEAELRMERMMQKELHVTRKCMCCRSDFLSEGAQNRMCRPCATQSVGMN